MTADEKRELARIYDEYNALEKKIKELEAENRKLRKALKTALQGKAKGNQS